jgi:hypothetical protein
MRRPLYRRALKQLQNILQDVLIGYSLGGVGEYEKALKRAMRFVGVIKRSAFGIDGDRAMVEAYEIYARLQRLSDYPQFFSDNTRKYPDRVVSVNSNLYTKGRPTQIHWDSAAMMAVPKGGEQRNWWRPPKRVAKVYTFTQQEIENAYPRRIYTRCPGRYFSRDK